MEVDLVEEVGSESYVFGRTTLGDTEQSVVVRVDWRDPPLKGDTVHVRLDEQQVHLFSTASDGHRIVA